VPAVIELPVYYPAAPGHHAWRPLIFSDQHNCHYLVTLMPSPAITISAASVDRVRMTELLAQATGPLVFDGCHFDGADLSRLDLQDAQFRNCSLLETSLYAARLSRSSWHRCRGGQAEFESADMVDAHFDGCDFNNATWRRAKMASATFTECKLTGANFEEVVHLGLSFADSRMVGADLRRLSFHKARLVGLDFQHADLSGCDFREAVFEDCSLRDAHLKDTRFDGADLRGADISGIKLGNASMFKGAIISSRQAAELMLELGLLVA
jgi:uncharacterized protein YjbI with pentapeptide repeats